MSAAPYPKRLIEVDLPIRAISAHARREKSIRHGHISTLHIWWARRPLAACRAILCAALWPDPADKMCPQSFRDAVSDILSAFAEKVRTEKDVAGVCAEHWSRWRATTPDRFRANDGPVWADMRGALLDFIADFANWDASKIPAFLDAARALTQAAHEALGHESGQRPVVADPFAGGGAIPLEAMRIGADCYASDLNPVAVLLNTVALDYAQKYGKRLADAIRRVGAGIKIEAERELGSFYPPDSDGAIPVAYLWARTATCEGPGCGVQIPLMTSFWLSRKGKRSAGLRMIADRRAKTVAFEIITGRSEPSFNDCTVRRGAATCPVCGFTTPVASVRRQLKERSGGSADALLLAVVTLRSDQSGRVYRLPTEADLNAVRRAAEELTRRVRANEEPLSLVPDERLDMRGIRHTWAMLYGLERWGDLFTPRQSLALSTFLGCVRRSHDRLIADIGDARFADAVATCLALGVDRVAERCSSLARWDNSSKMETIAGTFGRQALPMVWDFAEGAPLQKIAGDWESALEWIAQVVATSALGGRSVAHVAQGSAAAHPLPDDSVDAFVTDPPYYDAVPYAYLADFFYVWLKRALRKVHPGLLHDDVVPKDGEIVVDRPHELSNSAKDIAFYERELAKAFQEGRRIVRPGGIGTIVFASKTTASWEAILQAVVDAGWIVTGSWPIDGDVPRAVEFGWRCTCDYAALLEPSTDLGSIWAS